MRFHILALTCVFSFLVSMCRSQVDTLTILHFNDTHSALEQMGPRYPDLLGSKGGIARAATWVRMYRFLEPHVLLLHAGDAAIGDMFYNTTFGVAELQIMKMMGFDAMAIGNHEFDLMPSTLCQALDGAFAESAFPLLSANLVLDDPAVQPLKKYITPSTIKTYGKTKVGIFGLTTPAANLLSSPAPAVVDTNVIEIAAAMVQSLASQGCHVVICLSHLGVQLDQILASYIPGIHVIVGGHDHYAFPKPIEVVNPLGETTTIVQANAFYLNMGKLRLSVTGDHVKVLDYELININNELPATYDIQDIVDGLKQSIEATYGPVFSQQIGYAKADLKEVAEALDVPGRKDTPVGNLVTDAFRAATGTDIAFQVGGSTAMQLWHGPIVADDIFRMLGYGFNTDNGLGYRLSTIKMYGEALLGGIQFGLKKSAEDGNDEFLAQVSGMKYSYLVEKTAQGRAFTLESATVGGVPVDPSRLYTVTVNEFVPMFLTMLGIPFGDLHVYMDTTEFQVVAAYVAQIGMLEGLTEGRIECRSDEYTRGQEKNSGSLSPTLGNFPNPFNPATTISFTLPSACYVTLKVYNVIGQEIQILAEGQMPAGKHSSMFVADHLSSGVYFYRLTAGHFSDIKRMVLLK